MLLCRIWLWLRAANIALAVLAVIRCALNFAAAQAAVAQQRQQVGAIVNLLAILTIPQTVIGNTGAFMVFIWTYTAFRNVRLTRRWKVDPLLASLLVSIMYVRLFFMFGLLTRLWRKSLRASDGRLPSTFRIAAAVWIALQLLLSFSVEALYLGRLGLDRIARGSHYTQWYYQLAGLQDAVSAALMLVVLVPIGYITAAQNRWTTTESA